MTTQVSTAVWSGITKAIFETATITASAPAATANFDVSAQAVQFYTATSTNSFIFNLRGDSTTTLDTLMTVGQSTTVATLVTCSSAAHYLTAFRIDGNANGANGYSFTAKWQGGTASLSGNANSIDIYTVNVIKTAAKTFTLLASQTKFA
jgi:hypothetical protein